MNCKSKTGIAKLNINLKLEFGVAFGYSSSGKPYVVVLFKFNWSIFIYWMTHGVVYAPCKIKQNKHKIIMF